MRYTMLCCLLLAGCSGKEEKPKEGEAPEKVPPILKKQPEDDGRPRVRGSYPPPSTRLQGRTAAEWAKDAEDLDDAMFRNACWSLHNLREEGMPYLLRILLSDPHIQRAASMEPGTNTMRLSALLPTIDGRWVDTADLGLFVPFLDRKYAPVDGVQSFGVRSGAVHVFFMAGPRAKDYVGQLEGLRNTPGTPDFLRKSCDQAIAKIKAR